MSEVIKIKKGLSINLKGKADKIFIKIEDAEKYAIKPTDFKNLIPKIVVKVGDKVKAGTTLFYDKANPDILFSSPVSGTVIEIKRGKRRKVLEIIVQSDTEINYKKFNIEDPLSLSKEKITATLLESGIWSYIRQRPYGTVANPKDTPKSIFISAVNTAPLAPDADYLVKDKDKEFQTGIDVLSRLTFGKIHINVDARYAVSKVYSESKGVQINKIKGPHPAGNVGVQIHHIDPINKGDIIWYINPQDIIILGNLFLKGIYDASKIVALTGSEVIKPRYYKLINGVSIASLIKDNVVEGELRYISGNVLSGTKIDAEGFVGFYDNQISVIPEGNYYELFGWATPGLKKLSVSRTFMSWLMPDKKWRIDTNLKGGERAFVISGQYEKVFPMNIFPVHLLKAILAEDIDLMENLGIYEVHEEDFALCEFVCTSKIQAQEIIRKGIDMMIQEMS